MLSTNIVRPTVPTTTTIPFPTAERFGAHVPVTNSGSLLNLRIITRNSVYTWMSNGDSADLYREGSAIPVLTNVTMPVWVALEGGRALYVEQVGTNDWLRTSRVQQAEWFVEHGTYCVSKHAYTYPR